jgi:hypothetical protein
MDSKSTEMTKEEYADFLINDLIGSTTPKLINTSDNVTMDVSIDMVTHTPDKMDIELANENTQQVIENKSKNEVCEQQVIEIKSVVLEIPEMRIVRENKINILNDFADQKIIIDKWFKDFTVKNHVTLENHVTEYFKKLIIQMSLATKILNQSEPITPQQAIKIVTLWKCARRSDVVSYFKKLYAKKRSGQLSIQYMSQLKTFNLDENVSLEDSSAQVPIIRESLMDMRIDDSLPKIVKENKYEKINNNNQNKKKLYYFTQLDELWKQYSNVSIHRIMTTDGIWKRIYKESKYSTTDNNILRGVDKLSSVNGPRIWKDALEKLNQTYKEREQLCKDGRLKKEDLKEYNPPPPIPLDKSKISKESLIDYADINDAINYCFPDQIEIISFEIGVNYDLWNNFISLQKVKLMTLEDKTQAFPTILWTATDKETRRLIFAQGFKRDYNIRTELGKGCYLHTSLKDAVAECKPDMYGQYYLICALAILGNVEDQTNSDMSLSDLSDSIGKSEIQINKQTVHHTPDSVINNTTCPNTVAIRNDNAIYPHVTLVFKFKNNT